MPSKLVKAEKLNRSKKSGDLAKFNKVTENCELDKSIDEVTAGELNESNMLKKKKAKKNKNNLAKSDEHKDKNAENHERENKKIKTTNKIEEISNKNVMIFDKKPSVKLFIKKRKDMRSKKSEVTDEIETEQVIGSCYGDPIQSKHGGDDDDDDAEAQLDNKNDNADKKSLKRPPKFNVERNNRTIFVGNLPVTMDHRKIKKLFKDCGAIETVRIRSVAPEKTKLSRKVAFITGRVHPKRDSFNAYVVFKPENPESVEKALGKNGMVIENHHVRVDRATKPRTTIIDNKALVSRKKSVFVGNLRFDVTDDEIFKFFTDASLPVVGVRIVRDQETGAGKGFGFVTFTERKSVKQALELNETKFRGRSIRVKRVEEDGVASIRSNEPSSKGDGNRNGFPQQQRRGQHGQVVQNNKPMARKLTGGESRIAAKQSGRKAKGKFNQNDGLKGLIASKTRQKFSKLKPKLHKRKAQAAP